MTAFPPPLPILVLAAVILLIAVRQVGNLRLQIWHAMAGGALLVLIGGAMKPAAALTAVDADVMVFLLAMFILGQALEESGYLAHVSYAFIRRARTRTSLFALLVLGAGILSALLMNDTLAIVGVPVVLLIARKHDMPPRLLLLGLAFAITIGSVMSPIGNPQNLLIALRGGLDSPFLTFLRYLALPTVLNLLLTAWVLTRMHPGEFHDAVLSHSQEPIRDSRLAFLAKLGVQIVALLVVLKVFLSLAGWGKAIALPHIAVAGALPVLVGSPRRWEMLRKADWSTLAFFAGMFILMESVWQTGFFQEVLGRVPADPRSTEMILGVSVILSQFISNVPLVALYQPVLLHAGAGTPELMALAAGSTVAGNMLVLGAASNVIIIQGAERRAGETITFFQFARIGIPMTLLNTAVYWVFLRWV